MSKKTITKKKPDKKPDARNRLMKNLIVTTSGDNEIIITTSGDNMLNTLKTIVLLI